MSRNGSGTYSLPAGNPVVTGTSISSTWANNTMNDIANALTGSVASDGQTPMTGNLAMGGNKVTGLANGTNPTDAVTYSQLTGLAPATTGSAVLAGNGSGGFTNVTLDTGLSYSSGTLSADIDGLLPSQTGNAGKVLTTDGSTTSWSSAGAGGTVSSVAASGGTTGFSFSGSPITTTGTLTLSGTLAVTSGGTGSTTASGALTNLLPDQSGNSGKFLTTNGSTTSWSSAGTGTVTSVGVSAGSGISVSGSPITSSGTITVTNTGVTSFNSRTGSVTPSSSDYSSYYGSLSSSNSWSGTNTFTGISGFGASNPDSSYKAYFKTTSSGGIASVFDCQASGGASLAAGTSSTSSSLISFFYGSVGSSTAVGAVTTNGTATTYGTSSDRRLKTNIADYTNSGGVIDSLRPSTFTWISNGQSDVGFIADELQAVIPDAVHGQPNAVDAQGKPIYQQIDCSTPEMMANIVAELQSLRKRVAALESK